MTSSRPPIADEPLAVLGEHRGLLFVDKPAGLQTEPDAHRDDTLVTRIAAQLGLPRGEVHALSRLDTAVSGVVTLGLTHEARRLVTELRQRGQFRRRYLALATGPAVDREGVWRESIGRAAGNLRRVDGRNPEAARTDYAWVASSPLNERANPQQLHLLALAPETGRTHQLRVHSATHCLPLLGDRTYGGVARLISNAGSVQTFDRIALHAAWVELPLPELRRFEAPIPRELQSVWSAFGGDAAAFAIALQASVGERPRA
jgi:23S rRNA-/tRNA-specific pseudouridylate synthase